MRIERYLREVEAESLPESEEIVVSITRSPHGPTFSAMFQRRHIVEFQLDLAYRGLEDRIVGGSNGELRNVYVRSLEDGRIEVQLFEDDGPARMVAAAAVAWFVCGRPYPIPIPRPCTILFKAVAPQVEVERRRYYRGEYTIIRGYPEHVVSYLLHYYAD